MVWFKQLFHPAHSYCTLVVHEALCQAGTGYQCWIKQTVHARTRCLGWPTSVSVLFKIILIGALLPASKSYLCFKDWIKVCSLLFPLSSDFIHSPNKYLLRAFYMLSIRPIPVLSNSQAFRRDVEVKQQLKYGYKKTGMRWFGGHRKKASRLVLEIGDF